MPQRRVLLLNPANLTTYRVNGAAVHAEASFSANASGFEAFTAYLAAHQRSLLMLLIDVTEEGFQLEDVPFSSGKDRAAIVKRKLGQYFYGTPYTLAHSEGRLKTGRRDERLLLMALTQPQSFEPWLKLIDEAQARLAGIYSLPQVLAQLLPGNSDGLGQQLLITPTQSGLRQSFFDNRQLRFSRLTPLATGSAQESAIAAAVEAGKMHQYLSTQRLIDRSKPLSTRILVHPEQMAAMRERCHDNTSLQFVLADLLQESARLGLKSTEFGHSTDALCCHLLLRSPPAKQFALPAQRRFHRLWQMRNALQAASAILCCGGLLFAAKVQLDNHDLHEQTRQLTQQITLDQQRYDSTLQALPNIPLSTEKLRALVTRFDEISLRASGPMPLLIQLSGTLDRFPDITVDRLEWKIAEKLETATGLQIPEGGAAQLGSGPFAQVKVAARLPLTLTNTQVAQLDHVNAFFKHLVQTPGSLVQVQQMPVDLQSTKTLKSDEERTTPEAPLFSFLLIRKL